MSLIRNGGFERGNIDFWEVISGGTLEINDTDQKYGGYCGKFTYDGTDVGIILNKDYIAVSSYDLIDILFWIKSPSTYSAQAIVYCYDSDYSYIKQLTGYPRGMDGTYKEIGTQIPLMRGISYIRIGVYISMSTTGDIFYIDGYTSDIIKRDNCISGYIDLLAQGDRTVTGNTTLDKKDLQMYNTFFADLNVTYVGGTSPTLDVTVYEYDSTGHEILVGTFTQATAITRERIALSNCTGRTLYVKYLIGGTTPEFVFQVSVAGKG